jgi:hypothetical protein
MAQVLEIKQMMERVNAIRAQVGALHSALSAAYRTQEAMFRHGDTTSTIKTAMNQILGDLDTMAADIAADLDAIPISVWAEEVRIGNPTNFKMISIDEDDAANSGKSKLTALQEDGATEIASWVFANGDVVEIVTPEDSENAQEFTIDSAPPETTSAIWSTTGTDLAGGVDNLTDEKAKLILRER